MGLSYSVFSLTGGGTSTTGFYLNVGSSGNTTFTFDSPQPAGVYFISSKLQDASYDIYLATENGLPAGYTNGEILVATESFKHVVVYGSTQNDVLILESKPTVNALASGNIDGGVAPYALSAVPTDLESFDDTTTISGGNFATDVRVFFVNSSGVEIEAKSLVRVSSSELIATRPDSLVPQDAPYDIKVVNPGITLPSTNPNSGILFDFITVGTYPQWVTIGPVFWEKGSTTSLQLVAADVESSDIDYEIISGALFPGFSFDQETGTITGDDSALNTGDLAEFTVRATDTSGLVSSERAFSMYVNTVPVHSFFFEAFVDAGRKDTLLLFEHTIV